MEKIYQFLPKRIIKCMKHFFAFQTGQKLATKRLIWQQTVSLMRFKNITEEKKFDVILCSLNKIINCKQSVAFSEGRKPPRGFSEWDGDLGFIFKIRDFIKDFIDRFLVGT